MPNLHAIIESLLFIHGEPIGVKKLAKLTNAGEAEVKSALETLRENFRDRGIVLLEKDGEWQLGTHPAHAEYVEALMKGEFAEDLSKAAIETAAIIAYKGPLTKAEIEYLRRVHSSFTLRNLLMRGLVERIENPKDARSYLYRITFDFLKHMGVVRVEDLPRWGEFHEISIDIPEVNLALDRKSGVKEPSDGRTE